MRIYAETEQRIHTDHEDLFVGVMKYANGAVGLLDINWLTPTKQRRLSVTGEGGMYVADYLTQELTFFANPSDASVVPDRRRRATSSVASRYWWSWRRSPLRCATAGRRRSSRARHSSRCSWRGPWSRPPTPALP